jgi:hypothetical protein
MADCIPTYGVDAQSEEDLLGWLRREPVAGGGIYTGWKAFLKGLKDKHFMLHLGETWSNSKELKSLLRSISARDQSINVGEVQPTPANETAARLDALIKTKPIWNTLGPPSTDPSWPFASYSTGGADLLKSLHPALHGASAVEYLDPHQFALNNRPTLAYLLRWLYWHTNIETITLFGHHSTEKRTPGPIVTKSENEPRFPTVEEAMKWLAGTWLPTHANVTDPHPDFKVNIRTHPLEVTVHVAPYSIASTPQDNRKPPLHDRMMQIIKNDAPLVVAIGHGIQAFSPAPNRRTTIARLDSASFETARAQISCSMTDGEPGGVQLQDAEKHTFDPPATQLPKIER